MKDLVGTTLNRLTVIGRAETTRHGRRLLCSCQCGKQTIVYENKFLSGSTKSCGCLCSEKCHGKSHTRLYRIWTGMKTRCLNPNSDHFDNYMGRGITICDAWRTSFMCFYDWALSSGYKDGMTIDRIDPNGNYEPGNCRWETTSEQNRNKTTTAAIEYRGETRLLKEWAEITGVKYQTLFWRYKQGWAPEEIINGR